MSSRSLGMPNFSWPRGGAGLIIACFIGCLNPPGDLAWNVKLPQPVACRARVSCRLQCSVQPLYTMPRWCQARGRAPISWEGTGRGQREPSSPGFLFATVPPSPRCCYTFLELDGAKVRPLRKKECAFLNRIDKCIWAVETDLSYVTLQFLCLEKIALPPLHCKMSKDTAVQGGVASFWALQRPVSITCVLMICAEAQILTQSSMNP